jgi:hypothetical protein
MLCSILETGSRKVPTFTLDTNCIIDVDEARPSSVSIKILLKEHERKKADLALVASSASERQRSGDFLCNLATFNARRYALGFGELRLLPSIARWGISFFGDSLWPSDESQKREEAIYKILFPNSAYEWADYAASKEVDPADETTPSYFRWRNQLLDTQALWAHDFAVRDIFVTSDQRLIRISEQKKIDSLVVMTPDNAVSTLNNLI